ncbi:hypothetical protein ANOM_007080, partial [Aspergillus nomiae NRRL 13137]
MAAVQHLTPRSWEYSGHDWYAAPLETTHKKDFYGIRIYLQHNDTWVMLGASSETEQGLEQTSRKFSSHILRHIDCPWEEEKRWVAQSIGARPERGYSYTVTGGGWDAIKTYMEWIRAGLAHSHLWGETSTNNFVHQAGNVLVEHSKNSGNDWGYYVEEYWKEWNGENRYIRPDPEPPRYKDTLCAGEWLEAGHSLEPEDGSIKFTVQTDGNMVVYHGGKALFQNTAGQGKHIRGLKLEEEGNLCLYTTNGEIVWQTNTHCPKGNNFFVRAQDDGNVVFYHGINALWATNTQI